MSTAADHDQPYDGGGGEECRRYPDDDQPCQEWDREYCSHDRDCGCGSGPPAGSDPGVAELLDGPAADAMFGLGIIRDVPAEQLPPAVMMQAVLGAQRLASYAKAQAMYWTAALARPGVAVPVTDLLDSIAHRNDEQLPAGPIPPDLADRAAAGTEVIGDPVWDALLALEAAGLAESELSAAWQVAPITARRRIADAQELVDELPDTFQALEDGRIEEIRARIIAETTAVLDPQLRRRAEAVILDRAKRGMSPGDLRRLASTVVADVDPDAAGKRAEQARARRGTGVRNLDDDLGRFTADLAVEDAALTQAVLDLLAKAIPPQARHGRGMSQLRADIFADLFTALADTGLVDLRGLNPHIDTATAADTATDTDTAADTAGTDTAPTAADTAEADEEPTVPAEAAEAGASDRGCARPDPAGPDEADSDADAAQGPGADPAQPDPSEPAHADPVPPAPAEPSEADTDTERDSDADNPGNTEPDPSGPGPSDPAAAGSVKADTQADPTGSNPVEPNPAVPNPPEPDPGRAVGAEPDPDGSPPTAAQLLARLRSSDWKSHLDPNGQRRGGLLSLVRLPAGMRVNLDVTIALSTLAGCDDLSARLTGLGVITADTARALTTAAGTVRILVTHNPPDPPDPPTPGSPPGPARRNHGGLHHHSPDCGTVLDFGRTTYRPPATVLDRVNTRDQRCRFPGCPMAAERCDHDHRTTWDTGGATCPCNIDTLCRFHHRNKTFTTWTAVRDHQANTLTWTSPLGRVHVDRPTPDLPTGTPLNLSDTGAMSFKDDAPTVGYASPDLTAEMDPGPAETGEHGTELGPARDPDEPPF